MSETTQVWIAIAVLVALVAFAVTSFVIEEMRFRRSLRYLHEFYAWQHQVDMERARRNPIPSPFDGISEAELYDSVRADALRIARTSPYPDVRANIFNAFPPRA